MRWLRGLEKSAQLGRACADTRVINVCDREGDIWAMYETQARDSDSGLLVRSCRSKQRKVMTDNGRKIDLRAYMGQLSACGEEIVHMAAFGGGKARQARTARLEVRIAKVELCAPDNKPQTLPMIAVYAHEPEPPRGVEALDWLLLCSEGEAGLENARRILHWYRRRWVIEEFFRVLKSGTRIEKRMFDDAEDLRKCLAFDAITAWRVFDLERMARDKPQAPATDAMSKDEVLVLYLELSRKGIIKIRAPPDWVPDICTFVVDLGRYVGFRPTRRQPLPGTKKIWQGMKFLIPVACFYTELKAQGMLH